MNPFKFKAWSILTVLLWLLWVGVTSLCWVPVSWLAEFLENHGQHIIPSGIRLALFVYMIALFWLSLRMAYYMTVEELSFGKGVKSGLKDVQIYLAFLPFIGHWFIKPSNDKTEDENDHA